MKSEIEDIRDWLNSGREYKTGVQLVRVYLPDCPAIPMFIHGHHPEKLFTLLRERFYELKEAQDVQPENVQEKSHEMPVFQAPTTASGIIESFKNRIIKIRKLQGILHADMVAIGRNQLGKAMSLTEKQKELRLKKALELVELDKTANQIMVQMDYFRIHGQLPDQPAKKERKQSIIHQLDEAGKIRKLMSLRSIKSQTAKKIRKQKEILAASIKGSDTAKARKMLDKWEQKLMAVNQEIQTLENGA